MSKAPRRAGHRLLAAPRIAPDLVSFLASFMASFILASAAHAVDVSVSAIEITQGFQAAAGTTPLIARNATAVRVRISLNGQTTAQAGVDAVLRIYANGVEIPSSPVYSSNGPITAPVTPNSANINDTLNFICFPPQSTDVDFTVTVNPFRTLAETNYANNTTSVLNKSFLCRKMVDIAYVPVNYTFGAGLPQQSFMEPGFGDAFLRGIFKTGDWNYHRVPVTPPVVSSSIETANTALLNTLSSLRQTTIPAAGFQRPEFIYGWLPGNPFSGNGQAIGIPGDAAFGNTENSRFQRTFAHEIGHLWGLSHNSTTLGVASFDVEHQLKDPLNIAQVQVSTKSDIMVAGLLTNQAWVASGSYLDCINDARSACTAADENGGATDLASDVASDATSVMRLTGVHDHVMRRVTLDAAMPNELVVPTADNPDGNVLVEAFDAAGALLYSVRVDTRACRESCADPSHLHRTTSLFVNLPRWTKGREIARVLVREWTKSKGSSSAGRPLAEMLRTAHAPAIAGIDVGPAQPGPIAFDPAIDHLEGRVRISWNATDADGDALVADLLYSPNGGDAWLPVAVGVRESSFDFDASDLPASQGRDARFRVRVSDGLGTAEALAGATYSFGNSAPPDVHFIAPNTATSVPQGATVLLHASAWDVDDQLLGDAAITWTSSRDGALGAGRFLPKRNLSVGAHTITLRGTDSGGLFTEKTITITVTARNYNNGDFDGDGAVGASDLTIMLSAWGGNGIADMNLDGVVGSEDLADLLARWN
jgi:hypothetical protein